FEILFLNAFIFPRGKYLARNALEHASHVVSLARLRFPGIAAGDCWHPPLLVRKKDSMNHMNDSGFELKVLSYLHFRSCWDIVAIWDGELTDGLFSHDVDKR
ncbi:hypothetical protein U9M48_008629, partial [Paspalum notatum var. saurae]